MFNQINRGFVMRYVIFFALICISLLFNSSFANIINVPADIDSIQGGIDMAVDGDTVLVQPATYFESINFNGKNIVVGSLTLTTGDTSFISQTVLDGSGLFFRCVTFENGEDSTAHLCGFTIKSYEMFKGIYDAKGAGIYVNNASPKLTHLLIKNCQAYSSELWSSWGGGIYFQNSNSTITNVKIKNNTSRYGGGIFCLNSNLILTNVVLSDNNVQGHSGYCGGGGIYCQDSNPTFINVTIKKNTGIFGFGGGIYFNGNCNPLFDSINRSNIYLNETSIGKDLFSDADTVISIVVDTFTVMNPDSSHAYPLDKFTFDILHDTSGIPTKIEDENIILSEYILNQNYPNPFNPITTIAFDLPKSSKVTLKIFNILGEEVATFVSDRLSAGSYSYDWSRTGGIASGVYLYRLQAGNFVETKKMVLMR
jgi:hypothetical protein